MSSRRGYRYWSRAAGLGAAAIVAIVVVYWIASGEQDNAIVGLIIALMLALAPVALERFGQSREKIEAQSRTAAENALVTPAGSFPLVRNLSTPLGIGIHAAAIGTEGTPTLPPFVQRDLWNDFCEALRKGGFILLLGESTAGKSRLAYEAIRNVSPDHRFIIPQSRNSIAQLVPQIEAAQRFVLWLDDLERFLGPGGITPASLERILRQSSSSRLVIATMRTQEYSKYSPRNEPLLDTDRDLTRAGRDVLQLANVFKLSRIWSSTEISRAGEFVDDTRIAEALKHSDTFGVAEYLAAGPQLLTEWQDAWTPGTHPRGAALVAAAIDVRRAGMHRPISLQLLRQLHEPYLQSRGGDALRPESVDEAERWALAPLHATSSLLVPGPSATAMAFDYLADALQKDPASPSVPLHVWRALVDDAQPGDEYGLGVAAFQQGAADYTRAMLQASLDASGSHAASALAYSLGSQGGDPSAIAQALGELVRTRSTTLGPDDPQTLSARHSYAHWIGAAGDPARASRLFTELVADRTRLVGRNDRLALSARHSLAYWTGEAGHSDAAAAMFEAVVADRAATLGALDAGTFAARHSHAYWIAESGDRARGVQELESLLTDQSHALGPEHPHTLNTRHELARAIGQNGDPARALQLIQQVYDDRIRISGERHVYTLAALHSLARWTGEAGDPKRAIDLFRQVVAGRSVIQSANHPDTLYARYRLGQWLRTDGQAEAAVDELSAVLQGQSSQLAPFHPDLFRTRCELGLSRAAAGDRQGALDILRIAHIQAVEELGPASQDAARIRSAMESIEHE